MTTEKIILGIDPGTQVTGYGILKITKGKNAALDFGCIRPPSNAKLSDRYLVIYQALTELIEKHLPHEMAIEAPFFSLNAQSAMKLGMALGIALIAAKEQNMRIFSYSPREVKCSIVGTGKATKIQVQHSIARHLGLRELPKPYDAADALAIALCHIQASTASFKKTDKEI